MPIYKSTLVKFLKSSSTWFPLIITLLIVCVIGAILPFIFLDLQSPSVIQTYKLYIVASVTTIGSATSIVSATFASYKSVQIYKQEIEEGTFLILVSKPLSRKRIIFEKWLALFTIIAIYVIILISFYVLMVLLLDPGYQIANLDIPPIKSNIFLIGLILLMIVLMLTLMFSSFALIISSKVSASATIALVAGLGAIIPITGILPTFTYKQSQSMITRPVGALNVTRVPRNETISFIEELIPNTQDVINKNNILNLFDQASLTAQEMENNNKNDFVKNLGISSGENDIYEKIFWFDLNYQISSIATIASDLLIPQKDKNYIAASAMVGGFTQSPTLSGKVEITKANMQVEELSKMLLNTLSEYQTTTQTEKYAKGVFPFFDYILKVNNIINVEPTTNENFSNNMNQLLLKFNNNSPLISESFELELKTFLASPIIGTMLKDKTISEKLKDQLKNKDNPYYGEIKSLESLLLIKINIELGFGLGLIIYEQFVNNFYAKSQIDKIVDFNHAMQYLNSPNIQNQYLSNIINNFCKLNNLTNKATILNLANTLRLTELSKGGINNFKFANYANKWVLFGIYSTITFLLIPTSYFIIKKQDIR